MRRQHLLALAGAVLAAGALVAGTAAFVRAGPASDAWGWHAAMMQQHYGGFGPMMGQGRGPMMGLGGGPAAQMGPGPQGGQPADMSRHFIEEMIPHHEDAIAMADLALAQAEHQEIKDLAGAIKQTQAAEIEQMRAWYRAWYGTEVPPGMMAGRGHMMGGPMMGGHDPADIDGARPFDKAFIEAMIPHHQMAVMMASHTLQSTDKPELRGLLEAIVTTQSAEIDQMDGWYRQWYGTSVQPGRGPGMGPGHGPGMGGHHGGPMSPYAGQFDPNASIRALSPREVRQIQAGEGAGMALAAELNGLPGPRHVLDLADRLGLTAEQRTQVQAVFDGMRVQALPAGASYLQAQEALEADLRAGRLAAADLPTRVAEVNRLRGELQTVHIAAHLATTQALTPEQVARYKELRGY